MMGKQEDKQNRLIYINLDEFVPKQHLLRKIAEIVDFSFIYEKVRFGSATSIELHTSSSVDNAPEHITIDW